MIKLTRAEKPEILTDQFVHDQTEAFKQSVRDGHPKSVWNIDELKNALLASSYKKCAYCECDLSTESNYMEVEHFRDKHDWPDLVLKWDNLLPSCKHCNGTKSTHNVEIRPIVNPYEMNPKDHLFMESYRIKGKDSIGKETHKALNLNDSERLVEKRYQVGEELEKKLENLEEDVESYRENPITRRKNKMLNTIRDILYTCQPERGYAATCATVTHRSDAFNEAVKFVKEQGLWDEQLEQRYNRSLEIALLKK